jgi:hypothetical protein
MAEAKRTSGTPFKSKLRPYVNQIRKWRRAGFTWAAIADKLESEGCKTHAANLCQFMRRYRRRPFASDAEPETSATVPARIECAKNAGPIRPKEALTPYFEQLVDEAQEAAFKAEDRPVFNVIKPTRPL